MRRFPNQDLSPVALGAIGLFGVAARADTSFNDDLLHGYLADMMRAWPPRIESFGEYSKCVFHARFHHDALSQPSKFLKSSITAGAIAIANRDILDVYIMSPKHEAAGLWRPLRTPIFRQLLIADIVSDVGTFMQSVGAAWLMVSLGASPLYVALTQTASTLPFFLFALPAGLQWCFGRAL